MANITEIVNDFGENIVQVDGDIPIDLPAKDGDRSLRRGSISCQLRKMLGVGSKLILLRRLSNTLLRFREESVSTLTGFSS